MNALSIPPLIVAGMIFYAGFHQLLIYLRRREHRQDLTFALTCIAAGCYAIFCAGLYNASSVAEGGRWQQAQGIALALLALSYLWFVADYTGQVSRRALYAFSAYLILAAVAGIAASELTWAFDQPSIKNISLPFGIEITYYEATPGPLINLQSVMGLLLGFYVLRSAVRFYQSGQQSKARPLLVAMVFFFLSVINDTAVNSGLYSFVYTIEYAYLAIVLLMAYSLSGEVLEAATVKEALRESEEKFRSIVEASPMGIHMYRLEPEGRLIFTGTNPAADTILEVDNQQLIGKTIEEAFPSLAETEVPERYRRVCKNGESWQMERIQHKDGQIRGAFEVHAFQTTPGTMTAMFLDIKERKRAEEALRQERDLLNRLMETSPAGIVVVNHKGRINFANPRAEQVLGLARDEIGQRTYNDPEWRITDYEGNPFPDDELPFSRVMRTGQVIFGARHAIEWPDGQQVLLSINAAPLLDKKGQVDGMVAAVEDVTAQVRAQEALRESEERYRAMFESNTDGITITNLQGKIIDLNEAVVNLHSFERKDEILGKNLLELIAEHDREKATEILDQTLKSERSGLVEYMFLRKSGQEFDAELSAVTLKDNQGNPTGFIALTRDISERKLAEEALRQYTERLKTLRTIDQAILAAKSPEAIAEAAVSHIQRLVPCYRASVAEFDFAIDNAKVLAVQVEGETSIGTGAYMSVEDFGLNESLIQGDVSVIEDLQSLSQLSSSRQRLLSEGVHAIMNVPLFAQGELIGALNLGAEQPGAFWAEQIEVARELADVLAVAIKQARLHEQVQRHSEELEARVHQRTAELEAKNRELETFTYSVSHDLKAPLRGIDGYSRLLLQNYKDRLDEDGRYFLTTIRRATEQMNQLIDDLLTYSRLERRSLVKEQVYLPALLEIILNDRETEIQERGVTLDVDLPCEYVNAEAKSLSQVLRNLIDNALKFTQKTEAPRIEISGNMHENSCILWVKDNGIGFNMQYHDRIFEIFQRLHRAEEYPGTGIGLTLVHKVMQRIGGRVWAESAPGAGATFYLEIPK